MNWKTEYSNIKIHTHTCKYSQLGIGSQEINLLKPVRKITET